MNSSVFTRSRLESELIDSRISILGRRKFEVKLDYALPEGKKKSDYRVSICFFIPKRLEVNTHTYSPRKFYRDIQSWIRFKTPQVTIPWLLREGNEDSPFFLIKKLLKKLQREPLNTDVQKKVMEQLKWNACFMRSLLRDQTEFFIEELQKLDATDDDVAQTRSFYKSLSFFVEDWIQLRKAWIELVERSRYFDFPQFIRQSVLDADEYLSMCLEHHLTRLLREVKRKIRKGVDLTRSEDKLITFLKDCRSYHKKQGFMSRGEDSKKNE